MGSREARTLETPLRCRCPLSVEAVLLAIVLSLSASAVRAQISAGGDTIKGGANLEADLVTAPGGDPNLSGDADLAVNPRKGTVCFDIDVDQSVKGARTIVAVHIHPGPVAETCDTEDCAPPIDLDFANQGLHGCAHAGRQLLSSLVDEPEQFFLDVHTANFPAGAIRGQLREK